MARISGEIAFGWLETCGDFRFWTLLCTPLRKMTLKLPRTDGGQVVKKWPLWHFLLGPGFGESFFRWARQPKFRAVLISKSMKKSTSSGKKAPRHRFFA